VPALHHIHVFLIALPLGIASIAQAASPIVIDNASPGFTTDVIPKNSCT
jgi:hypothetical protein